MSRPNLWFHLSEGSHIGSQEAGEGGGLQKNSNAVVGHMAYRHYYGSLGGCPWSLQWESCLLPGVLFLTGRREKEVSGAFLLQQPVLYDHDLTAPALSSQPDTGVHPAEAVPPGQSLGKQGNESLLLFVAMGFCGHEMKFLSSCIHLSIQSLSSKVAALCPWTSSRVTEQGDRCWGRDG